MSTFTDDGFPNLSNFKKALDPNGEVARVINVLTKKRKMLDHIPWVEANNQFGHVIAQSDVALPSASWRKLNEGVDATKVDTNQYVETFGLLEDWSKIDEVLVELNGGAKYRSSRDDLKLEGFAQQAATAIIYENAAVNPERPHGLAARYPATTGYTSSGYVLKGTNGGNNCRSMWLVTWEENKIYGGYPKGTQAGLKSIDLGLLSEIANNKNIRRWATQFRWHLGIIVEDFRYAVRFQWDPDDANFADSAKGMFLALQAMLGTVYEKTPNSRIYMDRVSKLKLDSQASSNSVNWLKDREMGGEVFDTFQGVPICIDDTLVAETAIS